MSTKINIKENVSNRNRRPRKNVRPQRAVVINQKVGRPKVQRVKVINTGRLPQRAQLVVAPGNAKITRRQRARARSLRRGDFMSTYSAKQDINHAWFDYLRTLAQPMNFPNVRIPDSSMFPCATIQVQTRGIINSGGLGKGMVICYPQLHQSINIFSGSSTVYPGGDAYPTLTIDGVAYTPDPSAPNPTADVHDYTTLAATLTNYRTVSGCIHVEYIGTELNNSGECALACTPPTPDDEVLLTFDELADYNYSVTTAARDGGWQVWLPLGLFNSLALSVDVESGSDTVPPIQFGFQGLPLNADVFKVTICWNIEAYSNNQLLTANAQVGKPDALKQSVALSAMSSHYASKGLGGPARSSEIDWKGIVNTGINLLADYGPSIATAIGAFL